MTATEIIEKCLEEHAGELQCLLNRFKQENHELETNLANGQQLWRATVRENDRLHKENRRLTDQLGERTIERDALNGTIEAARRKIEKYRSDDREALVLLNNERNNLYRQVANLNAEIAALKERRPPDPLITSVTVHFADGKTASVIDGRLALDPA